MATGAHAIGTTKPKRDRRLHLSTARIWLIAAVITVFAFMFSFTKAWGERMDRLDAMSTSDIFVNKTYATIDGSQFSTESLKETRVTAYNVWATTCPPCIAEMPDLEKLDKSYPDSEFRVVGILNDSTDSDGKVVQKHIDDANKIVASAGVTYPSIVVSQEMYAFLATNTIGTPTTYFVDSNGKILKSVTGSNSYDSWKAEVDTVLAELG